MSKSTPYSQSTRKCGPKQVSGFCAVLFFNPGRCPTTSGQYHWRQEVWNLSTDIAASDITIMLKQVCQGKAWKFLVGRCQMFLFYRSHGVRQLCFMDVQALMDWQIVAWLTMPNRKCHQSLTLTGWPPLKRDHGLQFQRELDLLKKAMSWQLHFQCHQSQQRLDCHLVKTLDQILWQYKRTSSATITQHLTCTMISLESLITGWERIIRTSRLSFSIMDVFSN